MSKYCAGCNHWEKRDKLSDEYKEWKTHHKCDVNFSGSSGAMEPQGAVTLFKRSLDYNMIHASNFGWRQQNNVTFTSRDVLWSRPWWPGTKTRLCRPRSETNGHCSSQPQGPVFGQKLSDGKTIGGAGWLTDSRINSLQNSYGDFDSSK